MNMKVGFLVILLISFAGLSACSCLPSQNKEVRVVSVTSVLNRVKDELNAYLVESKNSPMVQENGVCTKGQAAIELKPEKVTLTLQTVAGILKEPTAGLASPLGVLSFEPSYSGSYSSSRTQTLVIPLNIDIRKTQEIPPGKHPLAAAILHFRNQLLAVNHNKTPCLQYSKKANFKLSLAFDLVNKTTGGFSFELAGFKLGNKRTAKNEAHQTLVIEFSLSGGELLLQ